jgi:hypothetical protein
MHDILGLAVADSARLSWVAGWKGRILTSLPAWRDTLRAETYEGYFDFTPLKLYTHFNIYYNFASYMYYR